MSLFKPNINKLARRRDIKGLIRALNHKDDDVCEVAEKALVTIIKESKNAADKAKEIDNSRVKLSLEHVKKFSKALDEKGINTGKSSPQLLPDYTGKTDQRLNHDVVM